MTLRPAVPPFVFRPHVEQGGVTITPDLPIHALWSLDEQGHLHPADQAAISSSTALTKPGGAGALQAAFTFTQASFGLLVGVAVVAVSQGVIQHVAAARMAWRYPAIEAHRDQVFLVVDGHSVGCLDQWVAVGGSPADLVKKGAMVVAPAGAAIEITGAAVTLNLEDRQEKAALSARYQIVRP